jgi:hypothetical protein
MKSNSKSMLRWRNVLKEVRREIRHSRFLKLLKAVRIKVTVWEARKKEKNHPDWRSSHKIMNKSKQHKKAVQSFRP